MSLTFGVHWGSEKESFGKPERHSKEWKQYKGTGIKMIPGTVMVIYDESLPVQKLLGLSPEDLV